MGERRREAARDVAGHMLAADGDAVGIDHIAVEEDGQGRGAAAHVDDADAQVHLVVHQARQPRGIGRDDQRADVEMAAGDAGAEVAHWSCRRRDDMHVDAEPRSEHAARLADAVAAVNRVADRQRL